MITIKYLGKEIEATIDNALQAVMQAAKDAGWSQFRVFINGQEVLSPENFLPNNGDTVEITPYDKWGSLC